MYWFCSYTLSLLLLLLISSNLKRINNFLEFTFKFFFEPLVLLLAVPPLNTALAISMQKRAFQDQCRLQDHPLEAMGKKLSGN